MRLLEEGATAEEAVAEADAGALACKAEEDWDLIVIDALILCAQSDSKMRRRASLQTLADTLSNARFVALPKPSTLNRYLEQRPHALLLSLALGV